MDVLWREGNTAAALRVEQYWNDLSQSQAFSLLCGYAMDNFREAADASGLELVCHSHTEVEPAESFEAEAGAVGLNRQVVRLQQRARALQTELDHRRPGGRTVAPALAAESHRPVRRAVRGHPGPRSSQPAAGDGDRCRPAAAPVRRRRRQPACPAHLDQRRTDGPHDRPAAGLHPHPAGAGSAAHPAQRRSAGDVPRGAGRDPGGGPPPAGAHRRPGRHQRLLGPRSPGAAGVLPDGKRPHPWQPGPASFGQRGRHRPRSGRRGGMQRRRDPARVAAVAVRAVQGRGDEAGGRRRSGAGSVPHRADRHRPRRRHPRRLLPEQGTRFSVRLPRVVAEA